MPSLKFNILSGGRAVGASDMTEKLEASSPPVRAWVPVSWWLSDSYCVLYEFDVQDKLVVAIKLWF